MRHCGVGVSGLGVSRPESSRMPMGIVGVVVRVVRDCGIVNDQRVVDARAVWKAVAALASQGVVVDLGVGFR